MSESVETYSAPCKHVDWDKGRDTSVPTSGDPQYFIKWHN